MNIGSAARVVAVSSGTAIITTLAFPILSVPLLTMGLIGTGLVVAGVCGKRTVSTPVKACAYASRAVADRLMKRFGYVRTVHCEAAEN